MKKLEFRAWVINENRMRKVSNVEIEDGEIVSATILLPNSTHPTQRYGTEQYPLSGLILMQSIDRKDKDDVDIYTGDVVKQIANDPIEDNPDFEFCTRKKLWVIKDTAEATWLGYYQEQKGDEFEVIDNIYSNPKLRLH